MPLIRVRKRHVGLRDIKRKTMRFEIQMTFVDGVTGFFFDGIALLCGRRLPDVSTLATLTNEKADLDFGRYFAPTKT